MHLSDRDNHFSQPLNGAWLLNVYPRIIKGFIKILHLDIIRAYIL